MKSLIFGRYASSISITAGLLAGCGGNQSAPQIPAIQVRPPSNNAEHAQVRVSHNRVRYILEDVGTFGGPRSRIFESEQWLLPGGILTGFADTSRRDPHYPNCFDYPDCHVIRAFLWKDHTLHDLGTLPHGTSSETIWINARGDTAGASQNGVPDPIFGEQNRAVLWHHGEIHDLGTLGGTFSASTGVNDLGAVAGVAENTVYDPNPFIPGTTQSRAFLWKDGHMRDLGTLGGTDAFGQDINNRGQVAGFSYTGKTQGSISVVDPFLWSPSRYGGHMVDLGGFGGTFGAVNALNDRGEAVGFSNLAGDQTAHPFLWRDGKLINLGTLGGSFGYAQWINEAGVAVGWAGESDDVTIHGALWRHPSRITDLAPLADDNCSFGYGINAHDEVVGTSFAEPSSCNWPSSSQTDMRAVLWQDGSIVNLNDVVAPGSRLRLVIAFDVDDAGDISGTGLPPGVRIVDQELKGHAFVLVPCERLGNPKPCGEKVTHRSVVTRNVAPRSIPKSQKPFETLTGLAAIRAVVARYFHLAAFGSSEQY
ncbi:MAG: hypothetical protein WB609_00795 [Candidatus Cybelea sp.]